MTNIRTKKHDFEAQKRKVFAVLFKSPATMLMVSRQSGVMRENICRYIRDFKKSNSVCAVKEGIDPITGFRAIYWSTNPSICIECSQMTLFE